MRELREHKPLRLYLGFTLRITKGTATTAKPLRTNIDLVLQYGSSTHPKYFGATIRKRVQKSIELPILRLTGVSVYLRSVFINILCRGVRFSYISAWNSLATSCLVD